MPTVSEVLLKIAGEDAEPAPGNLRRVVEIDARHGKKILSGKDHGKAQLFRGGMEKGESALQTAKRELKEETGYTLHDAHVESGPKADHDKPDHHPGYSGHSVIRVEGEASKEHGKPTHPDKHPLKHTKFRKPGKLEE